MSMFSNLSPSREHTRVACMHTANVNGSGSSRSSRTTISRHLAEPLCMSSSPLPSPESLRKTVASAAAAFLLAFSPAIASCNYAWAAPQSAAAEELSPAQMLIQKTTDMQVSQQREKSLGVLPSRARTEPR